MAKREPETVTDESTAQIVTHDELVADAESFYGVSLTQESKDKLAEVAAFLNSDAARDIADQVVVIRAALDAQDPVVYRYNGNAAAGESMAHVPLADIRASLWAELESYMRAGVEASHLYTKVEG